MISPRLMCYVYRQTHAALLLLAAAVTEETADDTDEGAAEDCRELRLKRGPGEATRN